MLFTNTVTHASAKEYYIHGEAAFFTQKSILEAVGTQNTQYKTVKRILWIVLLANMAVAAVKIAIGILSAGQSITADGIHSLADGSSNIVGLFGIWLAYKPSDSKHPYGHFKFEIMASLFIGVMLADTAVRIGFRALSSLRSPYAPELSGIEILLLIITVGINIIVAVTEYRCGKKHNSTILVTDSLHTRGDILISFAVLTSLAGIKMGLPIWIDGVMTVLIAGAVLISAWQIIKNCVNVLADSAVIKDDEVKNLLKTIPGIYDVHQVRSRGEITHAFLDLHVVVEPQKTVEYTHDLSHRLEKILKEHFGNETEVSIHLEPDDGRHGSN